MAKSRMQADEAQVEQPGRRKHQHGVHDGAEKAQAVAQDAELALADALGVGHRQFEHAHPLHHGAGDRAGV